MNLHRADDFENPEFMILLRHQDQKFKNLSNPNPEFNMLRSKNIKFKILKRLNPELKISKGPQNPELQDSEFKSQKFGI